MLTKSTYIHLSLCISIAMFLVSCSASAPEKNALLQQRVDAYHSAVGWNNAVEASTHVKDPLLHAQVLRQVKKDLDNTRITECTTESVDIDPEDENTAHVTAKIKYFKAPVNVIKIKEVTEKWQYSDKTWFLVETDAFK